ncbi:MAG TPA: hypothetical protein VHV83_03400 [Armatimonadota bacterium]|nr:hypothetical protein [Armatimonadota bacterium]
MKLRLLLVRIRRLALRRRSQATVSLTQPLVQLLLPLIAVMFVFTIIVLDKHMSSSERLNGHSKALPPIGSPRLPTDTTSPTNTLSQKATNSWEGQPPPSPAHFFRETSAYQRWRSHLLQILDDLTRRGQMERVTMWRQWIDAYEQAACQAEQHVAMPPMPSDAALRHELGQLPSPTFSPFYGYKVVLPWNNATYYYAADAIPLDSRFLLHANGIRDAGIPIRERPDVHELFAEAGITDPVAKDVFIKVSQYEGGFEAVNTWDTGYVSVGFIQFITGQTGDGYPLLHVLQRMKEDEARYATTNASHRNEFAQYFTDHGIDVRDGQLYVHDPTTGSTQTGNAAVELLIKDKRLIAIFQDAGCKSRAFQLAQLREAYGAYYLANNSFSIPVAEVSVYENGSSPANQTDGKVHSTPDAATDGSSLPAQGNWHLLKRHYVYGHDAVQRELANGLSPAQFVHYAEEASPGTLASVTRPLPNLSGTYGAILRSEGGEVALTQQAVRCGVRRAMESFESSLCEVITTKPPTLAELSQHEQEIIATMRDNLTAQMQSGKNSQQK